MAKGADMYHAIKLGRPWACNLVHRSARLGSMVHGHGRARLKLNLCDSFLPFNYLELFLPYQFLFEIHLWIWG